MAGEFIQCQYETSIAVIKIDRPEVLNAYNDQLLTELYEVLAEVFARPEIGAVILTSSSNRAFSVGGDIDYLEKLNAHQAAALSHKGQQICDLIEQSSPAVIAAIDGYALGGGMEISLACDIRLASTRARFGQPEVKLGLIPAFGATQRLPRLIGIAEAKELLFTGEIIDAALAYELGLINKVVTPRSLLTAARELALEITAQSAAAVKMIKTAINKNYQEDAAAARNYENESFARCFDNEEHRRRFQELKKIIKDDK